MSNVKKAVAAAFLTAIAVCGLTACAADKADKADKAVTAAVLAEDKQLCL